MVIGDPSGRRVTLFQEALARLGRPAALVVSYRDLLAGRSRLDEVVEAGSLLRIESPERDFEVERGLIAAGADVDDDQAQSGRIGRAAALAFPFDRGRILHPRQWYLGFRQILQEIDRQRANCPPHRVLNPPEDIAVMFDKPHCHDRFEDASVPCPRGLGTPRDYDDLRGRMREAGLPRVFVKLAHGSSASGVVALETAGRRVQATTTVEAVAGPGGELRLYNTRAIRRETAEPVIAAIIDALCRERAHAERWVPKAAIDGGPFDLRVVVIGGRACHRVARVGRSALTNLHLLNRRGDPEAVRSRMEPAAWEAALRSCERAARVVPASLYVGVDLVIAAGFRSHAVLEINAFGDLLPGLQFEGMDTYEAEMAEIGAGCRRVEP